MTNELSAYNEGFRDGQAQGCTNEMHLVATHNLPLVEADLAAERIENTRLREAFVTMEQAYNVAEADLAAARAALAGAEAERDAYRAALTKVATVELDALVRVRKRRPTKAMVLTTAKQHDSDITFAAPRMWIQVDRAAWLAWQGRQR